MTEISTQCTTVSDGEGQFPPAAESTAESYGNRPDVSGGKFGTETEHGHTQSDIHTHWHVGVTKTSLETLETTELLRVTFVSWTLATVRNMLHCSSLITATGHV